MGELARVVTPGGELVAAGVSAPVTVKFSSAGLPEGWSARTPSLLDANGSGTAAGSARTAAGTYEVLLGGEVHGAAEVRVDGQSAGSIRGALYPTGDFAHVGTIDLTAGEHQVELDYQGASVHPGSAEPARPLGPVVFAPASDENLGTVAVAPAEAGELCGRRWDWIAAYAR